MKTFMALWIASVSLIAGGYQRPNAVRWPASRSIAEERLQVGPVSLELRVRQSGGEKAKESTWPVSSIAVNSEFSASIEPFSMRIVIVVDL